MFGGLIRWWQARSRRSQRKLFEFFNGRRIVAADPWPIYRKLYSDEEFVIGRAKDDPTDMYIPASQLEEPEFSKAIACVHRSFGTQPYDPDTGNGLTETEAFALLVEFLEWCADLSKKNGGLPSSLPLTDSKSSPGPECPSEPTNSPLPSPCSPDESIPSAPLPC